VNLAVRGRIGDATAKETAREHLRFMVESHVMNNSRHALEHVRNDRMDVIYDCDAAELIASDPAQKGKTCPS